MDHLLIYSPSPNLDSRNIQCNNDNNDRNYPPYSLHRESKVAKQDIGGRIYQMNLNFFFENNYVNGTLFVTQNHVDWV